LAALTNTFLQGLRATPCGPFCRVLNLNGTRMKAQQNLRTWHNFLHGQYGSPIVLSCKLQIALYIYEKHNKKTKLSWWFSVHSIVYVETNAVWVRTVTVDPFFSSSATRRLCYWENGLGAYVLSDLFHGEDAEWEARCRCGDRWGILRLFSFGIWLFSPMQYSSSKQRASKRYKIVQLPGDKTLMYQFLKN
jgi:hypothetical protein